MEGRVMTQSSPSGDDGRNVREPETRTDTVELLEDDVPDLMDTAEGHQADIGHRNGFAKGGHPEWR